MIKRELQAFLVIGVLTVAVDFCVYRIGLNVFGISPDVAKCISFLAGTVFAYFANKNVTFRAHHSVQSTLWRFGLLYAATLAANVVVNATVLHLLLPKSFAISCAFLIATGTSAIMNFIGMKWFVFKVKKAREWA